MLRVSINLYIIPQYCYIRLLCCLRQVISQDLGEMVRVGERVIGFWSFIFCIVLFCTGFCTNASNCTPSPLSMTRRKLISWAFVFKFAPSRRSINYLYVQVKRKRHVSFCLKAYKWESSLSNYLKKTKPLAEVLKSRADVIRNDLSGGISPT